MICLYQQWLQEKSENNIYIVKQLKESLSQNNIYIVKQLKEPLRKGIRI